MLLLFNNFILCNFRSDGYSPEEIEEIVNVLENVEIGGNDTDPDFTIIHEMDMQRSFLPQASKSDDLHSSKISSTDGEQVKRKLIEKLCNYPKLSE